MNIRDKAFELKVHTQVAASRAAKPVTRFVREQRDAHCKAVEEKISDIWDEDHRYEIRQELQEMLGMDS